MECPRCGQRNLEGARFRNACGERLAAVCQSCAHANPPGSRFCSRCGETLAPAPHPVIARFRSPEAFTPRHLAEQILASRSALEGERKRAVLHQLAGNEQAARENSKRALAIFAETGARRDHSHASSPVEMPQGKTRRHR